MAAAPRVRRGRVRADALSAGERPGGANAALLDAFCDALWLEDGLSKNTIGSYRADLEQLGDFSKRSLLELTEQDLFGFLASRRGRASSAARMVSTLKRFYRYCLRERRVSADPTLKLDPPKRAPRFPKSLSEADVEALLAAPDTGTVDGEDKVGSGVINTSGGADEVAEIRNNTFVNLLRGTFANPSAEYTIDDNVFRNNRFTDFGDFASDTDVLIGSKYFAQNLPAPDYRPLFGVLWDMIGDANLGIYQEGHSVRRAPEIVSRVWQTAADLGYSGYFVPRVGESITDDNGYTVFNDFSARDEQYIEMQGQLGPAKGKDFASSIGPWLVTPDELADALREHAALVAGEVLATTFEEDPTVDGGSVHADPGLGLRFALTRTEQ